MAAVSRRSLQGGHLAARLREGDCARQCHYRGQELGRRQGQSVEHVHRLVRSLLQADLRGAFRI
eukprot:12034361-Alexandrium_andersonii.AAC.1